MQQISKQELKPRSLLLLRLKVYHRYFWLGTNSKDGARESRMTVLTYICACTMRQFGTPPTRSGNADGIAGGLVAFLLFKVLFAIFCFPAILHIHLGTNPLILRQ